VLSAQLLQGVAFTGGHVLGGNDHNMPALAALATQSWRGKLTIHARWEAPAWPYLRQAMAVLVREVGF
jgi:hypothetical protein